MLPYSLLLSEPARASVGLALQQSLVLVDEAHNLPEAIRGLHSARLTLPVVRAALVQLVAYTQRYAQRLAGRNLLYLGQIRKCLRAMDRHLTQAKQEERRAMVGPGEFLHNLQLDHINLFKVVRYLDRSKLPQKLLGFTNATVDQENNDQATGLSKHVSAMAVVQTFMEKLTFTAQEGKIVTDVGGGLGRGGVAPPALRFVLLHPAKYMEAVLEQAHTVALVGGTLRPFGHLAAELLPSYVSDAARADAGVWRSRSLTAYSGSHVVPPSHVCLERLSVGPTGQRLDFRHGRRHAVCDELGRVVLRLVQTVPAGVVVFLPSYAYEGHLVRHWRQSSCWQELQRHKRLYREPKTSQDVERTLQAYSRDAVGTGALLLSVVGGKMSEGINFANDMARGVVVVGLPYPDLTDPELQEKMRALDAGSSITGKAYYHNLCMRAVNQSVGRAIRHAQDHAAIVLADSRYNTDPRVWNSLPQWLKRSADVSPNPNFHQSMERLNSFFEMHKTRSVSRNIS